MKRLLHAIALFLLIVSPALYAQQETIKIWPGLAPGTENRKNEEKIVGNNIIDVYQPELTVFLPEKKNANRPAVLVFPGGGYRQIVMKKEGTEIAEWLNRNGIAAFVLKYRLNRVEALQDAQRAMSLVRARAKEFDIDPHRIGVIGFSAGGYLAANLATHYTGTTTTGSIDSTICERDPMSRPDFMILVYAAFEEEFYSSVNAHTPPAFIVHACDDDRVPVEESVRFYSVLRKAGVPCELHVYEKGGHGFALEDDHGPVKTWAALCIDWLRVGGFLAD